MSKETGGPAYPRQILEYPNNVLVIHESGMTLRDYFAAKAMQAMCEEVSRYDQFDSCAKDAYKLADAMLEARK